MEHKMRNGFKSFGEFCMAVQTSKFQKPDPRLKLANVTSSNESAGEEGGYLVHADYINMALGKIPSEENLIDRTNQVFTESNRIKVGSGGATPWGTSGVQAYWESENSQMSESKVAIEENNLKLNKLTVLVPATEELFEDAVGLDAYLRQVVPVRFAHKLNEAIVDGTGAGEPQGILNSTSLITVSKESGQSAQTIMAENVINMWSRLYGPCQRNALWLVNQDIIPQLFTMTLEGASGSVPVYMPANGAASDSYATLMGKPVIPIQACKTLGTEGDIILCDLSQYMTALRVKSFRQEVSMHVWFDWSLMCFKFVMRMTGQPWWASSITPQNSSTSLSCFVSLQTRS
jgi:HK97 family phage major capsid protein